jgi:hypothetical protein
MQPVFFHPVEMLTFLRLFCTISGRKNGKDFQNAKKNHIIASGSFAAAFPADRLPKSPGKCADRAFLY